MDEAEDCEKESASEEAWCLEEGEAADEDLSLREKRPMVGKGSDLRPEQ